jgi:hypothetical protein
MGLSRSWCSFCVAVGSCSAPGFVEMSAGQKPPASSVSCPVLGKPIIRVGLVGVTMRSNTHSLALPIATSSQGYSAGFRGTCIGSRFTEVDGQSRSWGAAILSHPRGGNCAHHRTPSCHGEDRFLPCLPSFTLFHMISVERVALACLQSFLPESGRMS